MRTSLVDGAIARVRYCQHRVELPWVAWEVQVQAKPNSTFRRRKRLCDMSLQKLDIKNGLGDELRRRLHVHSPQPPLKTGGIDAVEDVAALGMRGR